MQPLDPTKMIFNWANARACLERSELAYKARETARAIGPTLQVIDDPRTNAQAVVLDEENCISVAFRGSCAPEDFIQDAKCWLTQTGCTGHKLIECNRLPLGGPKVHHGFLYDFTSIWKDLSACMGRLLLGNPSKPIFVTGHSLGGALAILAAQKFAGRRFNLRAVYTFGQPRVGNRAFAKLYDAMDACFPRDLRGITYRVVNENDIVPRVPFAGVPGTAYWHGGQKVFLASPTGWAMNPPAWATALSDLRGFYHAARKHTDVLIGDHYLTAYRERMENL